MVHFQQNHLYNCHSHPRLHEGRLKVGIHFVTTVDSRVGGNDGLQFVKVASFNLNHAENVVFPRKNQARFLLAPIDEALLPILCPPI